MGRSFRLYRRRMTLYYNTRINIVIERYLECQHVSKNLAPWGAGAPSFGLAELDKGRSTDHSTKDVTF